MSATAKWPEPPGRTHSRYEEHTGLSYNIAEDEIFVFGQKAYVFIPHTHSSNPKLLG